MDPIKDIGLKNLACKFGAGDVPEVIYRGWTCTLRYHRNVLLLPQLWPDLGRRDGVENILNGIARKSAYFVISSGKRSPFTIDLGFWKEQILPATWNLCSTGSGSEKVLGIRDGSSGENSPLIVLKCLDSSVATSLSPMPGNNDLTSKGTGRSLLW